MQLGKKVTKRNVNSERPPYNYCFNAKMMSKPRAKTYKHIWQRNLNFRKHYFTVICSSKVNLIQTHTQNLGLEDKYTKRRQSYSFILVIDYPFDGINGICKVYQVSMFSGNQ